MGKNTDEKAKFKVKRWSDHIDLVFDDGRKTEFNCLPDVVLAFSCTQAPYHHPDALAFLEAVAETFQPEFVVCLGDEADNKALKKLYCGPDDISPGEELEKTKEFLAALFELFPEAICLTSNHGDERIKYAQQQSNLHSAWLRPWNEIIGAPDTWFWRDYLIMGNWLFEHGHKISKGSRANIVEETIKRFGRPLSVVRGHHHSEFGEHIKPVWTTYNNEMFQVRLGYVGCLMDRKHATYTRSPTMLGCMVITHGAIRMIPMLVDKQERWIGEIPNA